MTDDDAETDAATVTVSVTAVNNGLPVAVDDPSGATTPEDTAVITVDVLANDTLLDNAAITAFDSLSVEGGTVADNGDGTFTYTPASGFNGTDSFTYTLTDDDAETSTATVTVTVTVTIIADGDLNNDGSVDSADVLLAQRILLGLSVPVWVDPDRGNVAPRGAPDTVFNLGDVLVIQQMALGL